MTFAVAPRWTLLALLAIGGSSATAEEKPKKKMTYCAFVNPSGNSKTAICSAMPKIEAQKQCDAMLKKRGWEGTCDCTDDQEFINGRCG